MERNIQSHYVTLWELHLSPTFPWLNIDQNLNKSLVLNQELTKTVRMIFLVILYGEKTFEILQGLAKSEEQCSVNAALACGTCWY